MDIQEIATFGTRIQGIEEQLFAINSRLKIHELYFARVWVRRKEALRLLHISNDTLTKYATSNTAQTDGYIRRRYEGKKPLYNLHDIERYLITKKRLTAVQTSDVIVQSLRAT